MTSPDNPPALPTISKEIFEAILPYLRQSDLCQCVLTSRAWNRIFIPYLWQSLVIHSRKRADQFGRDEAQQALKRNASYVRELRLSHESLNDQFLPKLVTLYSEIGVGEHVIYSMGPLSCLHSLELCYIKPPKGALDKDIFALVRQNPSLRRLKINVQIRSTTLTQLVTKYMPNLEDLDVDIAWRGDLKELLENLPESIRLLRMKDIRHYTTKPPSAEASKPDDANPVKRKARLHHSLEFLDISGVIYVKPENVLAGFFESCGPKLKTIRGMAHNWSINYAPITTALSNTRFVQTELRRHTFQRNESDDIVAKIIASFAWTVMDLYTKSLGPMAVNAILDNCDNLTALDIMEPGNTALTGAHMQTIMSKAKHLKSLQVHWLLSAQKISATDILASQWASTTLEHIDFKIHVPRVFDEDITEEDDQAAAIETSRNIQRQLLQRLGQQIHLKNLVIGGTAITARTGMSGYQRDCVEFTLETGLDGLKDLKKLELLDITYMDHRAGVPELEWMVDNWPRIHRVYGMRNPLHPSDFVKEWLKINLPSWGWV